MLIYFQGHLTSSGAFDSYKAYELMCKDFLPLIDQHSKKMREDLQALERGLDVVITTQKEQFSEVYQFVQEAVLLWNDQKNVIDQLHRNYEARELYCAFAALWAL